MSCSLRVLCPHNLDSTPCVVFSTENQRVLIDAGEGVQRLCVEHRVRLGKLESVLLTSLSPSTLSGLPGLCLTCADSGRSALSLVGPRGLLPFWQSTGQFTYRSQFSIGVREVGTDVDLVAELDAAYIHCVAIDSGNEEYPTHMCYVIETKPLPGKFDVGRAKALGVPVGPMFGLLQKGTEITLSDGRTIKPQDVLGVAEKSRFAVVVCNAAGRTADDTTILSSLVNHPYWCRFKSGGECEGRLDCMLHFSPSHVTSSSLYTAWIGLIGNTTHIGLGDGDCSPESAFLASTLYSCRLNSLFPDVFSLVATSAHQRKSLEGMMKAGCPGMRYNLLPAKQRGLEGSDATESFDLALCGAVDQLWEGREDDKDRADILVRSTLEARSTTDFNDPRANLLKQSSRCAVSFLGTGCAQPSKYRNVSGIFLQVDGGAIMLDCGEGSWQQLVRMAMHTPKMMNRKESCSSTEVEEWAATALKLVWISHPHADHHLGLVRVISERRRLLKAAVGGNPEPLLVIAPLSVLLFLEEFAVLDPLVKDAYTPLLNSYFEPAGSATESRGCTVASEVACENTCGENLRNVKPKRVYRNFQTEANTEKAADILRNLSITAFRNVKVVHCSQAYAVSLEFSSGCKIVYSGDTRPCQQVVDLGRDATILIHEATFDDTKGDEAVKKKHSTISEAIQVGKEMNAYRVILTHFSQRYPSAPPLPSDCQTTTSSVILAFDFLRLSFADCLWAPLMNRVLSIAFPPESDELDDINNEACTEGQLIDSNRIPKSEGGKKGKNRPLPSGGESVSKVPKYK